MLHCSFLNYSIWLSCWIQIPPLGNGSVSNDDPTITLTSMLRKNFLRHSINCDCFSVVVNVFVKGNFYEQMWACL